MFLQASEPAAGPWRVEPIDDIARLLRNASGNPTGRPAIVAVDGRGGSGKSTFANLLHAAVAQSAVVHTDDVAWHESFFGWAPLLADGVLAPLRAGEAVEFRPPAWAARRRPGGIAVPAGLELLIVEGVGAAQRELMPLIDAVVWVQSDYREAERRGIARDIEQGVNGDPAESAAFWHEWMAEELPFLDRERPWERAVLVAAGTAVLAHGDGEVVVANGPLGR
ncbi:uridine kinase [Lysobacter korlensis]|uniref:Uridine kinase n=1 Tax=Lysobacter korlensis TaxID=553636 RepID=A0ABV6RT39_9GAMM